MATAAPKSLFSRTMIGGYDESPQTIIMPPYHETATIEQIRADFITTVASDLTRTTVQVGSRNTQDKINNEVDEMSISREELDAKLAQNKAEVSAVATEMRREMSEWRVQQTEIMMKLQSEVSTINVKLDERFEAQKRSSSLIQWLVGIILAFVALVPAFQGMFDKSSSTEKNTPVVIQVPQPQVNPPPQAK